MLFDIFRVEVFPDVKFHETLELVKISGNLKTPIQIFALELLESLKGISSRDTFELIIDANGNNLIITDCQIVSIEKFTQNVSEYAELIDFDISLSIAKGNVGGVTSVYFLQEFAAYLNNGNFNDVLKTFSAIFSDKHEFEVYHAMEPFHSETICFYSVLGHGSIFVNVEWKREEILELFRENSTTSNKQNDFIPNDFHFLKESRVSAINNFFSTACSVLCLAFISNYSKVERDLFNYRITGYKSIICDDVPLLQLASHQKILFKIYCWAYSGGNNSDKVGLIRNVLSIHLNQDGSIRFDSKVWDAVQSNYQIYLKRNIQSYLEVKSKLGELIMESTSKSYAMVDQVLDSFKNNAFIILTFILTVVVINGLKDSGETTVFSNAYLAIVVILSIVSGFWLIFTRIEVIKRFDTASNALAKILKINYGKILMEAEIDESINPVVTINRDYLTKQMRRYTCWWLVMLAVFVSSFGICNRIFSSKVLQRNHAPEKAIVVDRIDVSKVSSASTASVEEASGARALVNGKKSESLEAKKDVVSAPAKKQEGGKKLPEQRSEASHVPEK
ncbi:hypothetical protein [Janthinobacterium sp. GW458P]|uniref:hypothetical protein n=1 Tax=Janthinobacterium sp. GW458P TaxID=1981504 RepID=UPI0011219DFD|nr:hypothetical protein [Janthinobacterium sp. GW458P]MBE3026190.1 hypothetical protein [Janthinobacterium sp. GW458P]